MQVEQLNATLQQVLALQTQLSALIQLPARKTQNLLSQFKTAQQAITNNLNYEHLLAQQIQGAMDTALVNPIKEQIEVLNKSLGPLADKIIEDIKVPLKVAIEEVKSNTENLNEALQDAESYINSLNKMVETLFDYLVTTKDELIQLIDQYGLAVLNEIVNQLIVPIKHRASLLIQEITKFELLLKSEIQTQKAKIKNELTTIIRPKITQVMNTLGREVQQLVTEINTLTEENGEKNQASEDAIKLLKQSVQDLIDSLLKFKSAAADVGVDI